jgi:uncharacterized protein YgiM (DUF1202 family)
MKKLLLIAIAAVLILPSIAIARKSTRSGRSTGKMNVQVREVIVRSKPNYLSTKVGKVYYGDQVNVVGKEGNWCNIDSPGGWIPKNVVTKLKVKVNPDEKYSKGTTMRHDEVALAGKGFNPQVEAEFKKKNRNLATGFARVDQIERYSATENELKNFRRVGKLEVR